MTKHKPLPSQERLQELFDYSVITGELRWKVSTNSRVKVGDVAGTPHSAGYRTVSIDCIIYLSHRLIWKLVTGEDPGDLQVDHKDLDKTNNSWINLRLATDPQNKCNSDRRRDNTTGYKGVSRIKSTGKYKAEIKLHGRSNHLGCFPTPEEAHAAYCKAALELHGQFARTE